MISVCIPSFNGEKFIYKQIQSILSQLSDDDEIVISDDSSTDGTIGIIKSFNDKRIVLMENNKFNSPIFNLENSLKKAKGDFVFLADQDDIWVKNKIEVMKKYLVKYDLVVSDCYIIDENENEINASFFSIVHSKKGFIKNFIKNSFLGCCMAFNKKILNYTLPFPGKIAMHDIWIGLNAEIIGKTCFINEKLIYYRRHNLNFSSASEVSKFNLIYKLHYRLIMLYLIFVRFFKKILT